MRQSEATRGSSGQGFTILLAIEKAVEPDSRTTAIALRPGTVDSATMVSSSPGSRAGTDGVAGCRQVFQEMTWLENANVASSTVRRKQMLQALDGVVRTRGDVLERTPMIWDQIARAKTIEELKSVGRA